MAAGKYYYDQSGIPPPGQLDFQQDAVRKGTRSQFIKLLNGTQKNISTWDNVNREWKADSVREDVLCKGSGKVYRPLASKDTAYADQ